METRARRATSTYNFLKQKIERLEWGEKWLKTFGKPPVNGIWYIGGHSGSGKTTFIIQLIKEFTNLGKQVRFYNFEEGSGSPTLQNTCRREGVEDTDTKIQWVNEFIPYSEIKNELKKGRMDVVVIDSCKEVGMKPKQILELKRTFPKLIIVIICHVLPNGVPESAADRQVKQAARMKITVDRFRAINEGRTFGEIDYYEIWKEKADELWAEVE